MGTRRLPLRQPASTLETAMNMSYCRFLNTRIDFQDCIEHLRSLDPNDRHPNTDEERRARAHLIAMAADLLAELGIDDPTDAHAIAGAISELDAEPIETDDEEDWS